MVVAWRLMRVIVHLFLGMAICAFIFPFIDVATRDVHIRNWSRHLLAICNVSVQITSRSAAPKQRALVVANHVSWLDIFVINALYPCRFVAKSEIRSWPLAGWLVEKAGTVFIARGNRRDLRNIFKGLVHTLQSGQRVAFFPEGTTAPQGTLLPFHPNLFEAGIDAKCKVQPYAIAYVDEHMKPHPSVDFIGDMTFAQSMMAILRGTPIRARVTILPAMRTDGAKRRDLAEASFQSIRMALNIPQQAAEPEPEPEQEPELGTDPN
jgi:1-acyl-sn-glycerol-3-phosphate acyltransferase